MNYGIRKKILYLTILGMAGAIPFVFNPFGFFRYEVEKIYLFRLIVSLMFAGWLVWMGSLKNIRTWLWQWASEVKFFDVELWQIFLLAAYGLATTLSISPADSFWGLPDREFGLITVAGLILFFWLGRGIFNRVRQVESLCLVILIFSSLISLYAVLQKFGLEFISDARIVTLGTDKTVIRPLATLGHPNYLGAYLAMVFPFILFYYARVKKKWLKIIIPLIMIVHLAALYFTLNRGGWLAGMAGILCFLIFYSIKIKQPKRVAVLSIAMLVVIAMFFTGFFGFGGDKRTKDLTIEGGSMYVRIQEYKYALTKIIEKPLLGYGPETYMYLAMNREYTEKELQIDDRLSDRVHNIFLDMAINIGLIGLIIFIGIFIKMFSTAWKKIQSEVQGSGRLVYIAAGSSLIAYLVEVQFHFDTIVTSIFVAVNFILIYANFSKNKLKDADDFQPAKISLPVWCLAAIVLIISIYLNIGAMIWNVIGYKWR